MHPARPGHAVPFIVPDASGSGLAVTPEAAALLSTLGAVAPIAVLGKYRTGKSFLSNSLVGSPGAFEVGPTIEACTKGIWLWSEPLPRTAADGTPFSVLFLDTECVSRVAFLQRGERLLLLLLLLLRSCC